MKTWPIPLILGIIGLLSYFLFFMFAIGFSAGQFNDSEGDYSFYGQMILIVCTPALLLPSIILTFFGYRSRKKYEKLQEIADLLKAYRSIKISDLARKIGKSEQEAIELINKCIKEKLVFGYLNQTENIFMTSDYTKQVPKSTQGWKCTACGAFNDSLILPGETAKCGYCGKIDDTHIKRPQQQSPPPAPYREPAATTPAQPHQMAAQPPPPMYSSTNCNLCGTPIVFVSQYNKWYCNRCGIYA
ncbi:MAG: PCI domain-containing protein [Candidatus Thorarchaeota archaeon]